MFVITFANDDDRKELECLLNGKLQERGLAAVIESIAYMSPEYGKVIISRYVVIDESSI